MLKKSCFSGEKWELFRVVCVCVFLIYKCAIVSLPHRESISANPKLLGGGSVDGVWLTMSEGQADECLCWGFMSIVRR